jgi:hypothetical protein
MECLGLAGDAPEVGPAPKQLIDLPHEGPGPGRVGGRKLNANELDPGLNGEVGQGVGQQMPRRRRIRRSVVGLLVALSCLLVLLSTTVVWAHRTLLTSPLKGTG